MTIKEAKIYITTELSDIYHKNEISGFIKIIFSDFFNLSPIDIILQGNKNFSNTNFAILKETITRLKKQEPIQQIIGFTEFYDLKFNVNKDVLIPRPETEELVDLIINENKYRGNIQILDIGTGTGCIAISLSKNILQSQVTAFDISKAAIEQAKKNAILNNASVSFKLIDIINYTSTTKKYDIIVSNPPYVTNSEKEFMDNNVLSFEPHLALFVDDKKPLIFYSKITEFASKNLNKKGKLYFEINEKFGEEVKKIMSLNNFKDIIIKKDINGKDRIVFGSI